MSRDTSNLHSVRLFDYRPHPLIKRKRFSFFVCGGNPHGLHRVGNGVMTNYLRLKPDLLLGGTPETDISIQHVSCCSLQRLPQPRTSLGVLLVRSSLVLSASGCRLWVSLRERHEVMSSQGLLRDDNTIKNQQKGRRLVFQQIGTNIVYLFLSATALT